MNNSVYIDLRSTRAKKARLAKKLGKNSYAVFLLFAIVILIAAIFLYIDQYLRLGYILLALSLLLILISIWIKRDLLDLSPSGQGLTNSLSADILSRLNQKNLLSGEQLWSDLNNHWHINFLVNRLFIPKEYIYQAIKNDSVSIDKIFLEVERLVALTRSPLIEPIHIAVALMNTSSSCQLLLNQNKLEKSECQEILTWLCRILKTIDQEKPKLQGIGRDWSFGFTNLLNRFGYNISQNIISSGSYFSALTDSKGVENIKNALNNGARAIVLVGDDGVGKTSHVYALAQSLLVNGDIDYHQIVSLDPSDILSSSNNPGNIERILTNLLYEATAAGHIIIFFDDAQRFFSSGLGAFDVAQVLLPIIQASKLPVIFAMNNHDFQLLKSTHTSFANQLYLINIGEPNEEEVMHILEDTALGIEHKHNILITFSALKEAYRLSGRYDQDLAYPGKAIRLLNQSVSYAENNIVSPLSIQKAIEQSYGVKTSRVQILEARSLLNLEDMIHARMINQSQAVKAVSDAIRRARAGVADPRRPFGSFMFLGPTGVGKTELAKAVADIYYGTEDNMIRLDMTEYQNPEDVDRLLSDGSEQTKSLILAVRQQPFSVVLLDEIEKAHPNILNLLLQLLDEGHLTDMSGRRVSFKDSIIIATSNAGSQTIREYIESNQQISNLKSILTNELIKSGQFKPELLNRFDEIVVFRPLNKEELNQVVGLMMKDVNKVLSNQKVSVNLTNEAIAKIVEIGYDPVLGARPMRRAIQDSVENVVAQKILTGEIKPGDQINLDVNDLPN
jgi:ATP-dependent Clp protease ATP-binding subunit ClpC